jgi:predicted MFS family arabinose efflux permease
VLLMSFSFSIYPLITQEVHLYIAQALFGLGVAFNLPAWRKLFSRFVDKGREGMEWSIYDTILSFCMAVAATLGGTLAVICGFPFLFNISALVILFGGILPLFLLREKAIKAQNAKVV